MKKELGQVYSVDDWGWMAERTNHLSAPLLHTCLFIFSWLNCNHTLYWCGTCKLQETIALLCQIVETQLLLSCITAVVQAQQDMSNLWHLRLSSNTETWVMRLGIMATCIIRFVWRLYFHSSFLCMIKHV